MRDRFHHLFLALFLALLVVAGCSKSKPVEVEPKEEAPREEAAPADAAAPAPAEGAPSPVEPVPAPESSPSPAPEASTPAPTPAVPGTPDKTDDKSLSFWDRMKPAETPLPPSKPEPLKIYYQKDPIAEAWCEAWTASTHFPVQQQKFPAGAALPSDGDIYLFTPDRLNEVVAGPGLLQLEANWARSGIDPVFIGHSFDAENSLTRPWRWTPYLLYGSSTRVAPWKGKRMAELWADPKALWPDQPALLAGLLLKDEKSSANPRKVSRWNEALLEIQKKVHEQMATENDCWSQLQAGSIDLTYLPATLRLLQTPEEAAAVDCALPPGGTLIYFEQLGIGQQGKHKDQALAFAGYLLNVAQQKKLLPETGYFSVKTRPGSEGQQGALKQLDKDWFNKTEFIMAPPAPAASPAPVSEKPVETAPETPAETPAATSSPSAPATEETAPAPAKAD